jgi:hypothetical protein
VALGGFLTGLGVAVYNINQVSLRQAITPDHLLGRMNASMRFLVWGVMPLGALLGLRPTLLLAGAGMLSAALWIHRSPVGRLNAPPQGPEDLPAPDGDA